MTFGACWTCDADATGANALDGRAAEETGGVDGGSTGSTCSESYGKELDATRREEGLPRRRPLLLHCLREKSAG